MPSPLALLLPIRRQRLARAERLQRQEERELARREEDAAQAQRQLAALRADYQRQRERLPCGQPQTLETLQRRLERERHLRRRLHAQITAADAARRRIEEQRRQCDAAREAVRLAHRAVEKLEYLLTLHQEPW